MNKEYLVSVMLAVQAGVRSCRHAATEVMKWSDEKDAEIAALTRSNEKIQAAFDSAYQSIGDQIEEIAKLREENQRLRGLLREAAGGLDPDTNVSLLIDIRKQLEGE